MREKPAGHPAGQQPVREAGIGMRAIRDLQRARGKGRKSEIPWRIDPSDVCESESQGPEVATKLVSPARRWARGTQMQTRMPAALHCKCERQKDRPGSRQQAIGSRLQAPAWVANKPSLGRVETTLLVYPSSIPQPVTSGRRRKWNLEPPGQPVTPHTSTSQNSLPPYK